MTFFFFVARVMAVSLITAIGDENGHGWWSMVPPLVVFIGRDVLSHPLSDYATKPAQPGQPGFWALQAISLSLVVVEIIAYAVAYAIVATPTVVEVTRA